MKLYKHRITGEVFRGDAPRGEWPDGSKATVHELATTVDKTMWEYVGNSEDQEAAKREDTAAVYDLATKLALAFANGGVNAPVADCIAKAKELVNFKNGGNGQQ